MRLNGLTKVILLLNVSARLNPIRFYNSTVLNLAVRKKILLVPEL